MYSGGMTIGQFLLAIAMVAGYKGAARLLRRAIAGNAPGVPSDSPDVRSAAMRNHFGAHTSTRLKEIIDDSSIAVEARAMARAELERRTQ